MRNAWMSSLIVVTTLWGCASSKPDAGNTGKSTATASLADGHTTVAAANAQDMPIPPKDSQYTIYCEQFNGPDHLERSRYVRQELHDGTSLKDWYVVHGNDQSTLYYGFYVTFDRRDSRHKKQADHALADLDTVRSMVDANGVRPFSSSLPVPIDSPDPAENPAWDLSRTSGFWSLQVGAYKDSADRKQAAVESVADMRAHGIEAYYFHGSTISSVCIGCWPREAVREVDPGQQNNDPDQNLIVTPQALDANTQQALSDKMGMKNVAPIVDPIDPTLIATMRQYPQHAVNGQVLGHAVDDPVTGERKVVPESSFLVKIEHHEVDDPSSADTAAAPPATAQPDLRPGMGTLRSLGN